MKKLKIKGRQIDAFEQMLREEEKSEATVQKYMHDIKYFVDFTEGRGVDKTLIMQYKAHLKAEYALTSANSMLAALNSFLRFEGRVELCVKQFKIQKTAYCSEDKELTRQEYEALVKAAEQRKNERLSLVIQTICGTGIRVSELEFITVEAVRKGEAVVSCKGKTRNVFIVAALRKKLLSYALKQGIARGKIFVTKSGKALNRGNIWHDMKSLCKSANVNPEKVFPHNLRHLFARTFYSVEQDIARLADILGHSNINTTRIYMVSTGAEHRKKVERMRLII